MPRNITFAALLIYLPLTLLACAWTMWRRAQWPFDHPHPWLTHAYDTRLLLSVAAAIVLAAVVIGTTRALVVRAKWAADLHTEFRRVLGPRSHAEIVALALSSGLAEEIFFRGALQPSAGLFVSALVFGCVHVGPTKTFVPWTLWAFAMGLALGLIYEATGVLWGPVLAHVAINYWNMRFIVAHDPNEDRAKFDAATLPS